jgi:hypothetical protein
LAPEAFLFDLIEETGPDAKFLLFSQNNPSLHTNNEVQSFQKLTADSDFPPPKAFAQTLYDIVLSLKYPFLEPQVTCWSLGPAYSILIVKYRKKALFFFKSMA